MIKLIPFKGEDSTDIVKVEVVSVWSCGLLSNNAFWVSHKIFLSWTKSFKITSIEQGGLKQGCWRRQGIKSY